MIGLAIAGGIGAATAAAQGASGAIGAKKQQQAAEDAQREQLAFAREQQAMALERSDRAAGLLGDSFFGDPSQMNNYRRDIQQGGVLGRLTEAGRIGNEQLREGLEGARGDLFAGQESQLATLGQAGQDLRANMAPITGLQSQAQAGLGTLQQLANTPTASQQLAANPQAVLNDPAFQFRQQQGEQAINRAAAARGGRLSGRTLQELSRFNQGLASEEIGNAFARAQATDAMAGQRLQALAGAQMGLGQTGLNAQQQLASSLLGLQGQRAGVQGQTAQSLSGLSANFGQAFAQHNTTAQNNMAQMLAGLGSNQANALMGGASQATGLAQSAMPGFMAPVQYAGGAANAIGGAIGGVGNSLASLAMFGGMQRGAPR